MARKPKAAPATAKAPAPAPAPAPVAVAPAPMPAPATPNLNLAMLSAIISAATAERAYDEGGIGYQPDGPDLQTLEVLGYVEVGRVHTDKTRPGYVAAQATEGAEAFLAKQIAQAQAQAAPAPAAAPTPTPFAAWPAPAPQAAPAPAFAPAPAPAPVAPAWAGVAAAPVDPAPVWAAPTPAPAAPAVDGSAAVQLAARVTASGRPLDRVPIPMKRRKTKPDSVVNFDELEVDGFSTHIPATPEKPEPHRHYGSTVSAARKRYAVQTGVDSEGNPVVEYTREFMIWPVDANDPRGPGARVARVR